MGGDLGRQESLPSIVIVNYSVHIRMTFCKVPPVPRARRRWGGCAVDVGRIIWR